MQTTLLSIAIALILALLAALIGPHFIYWNDHRAFFEAEASRLVGLRVRVSGDIDAKLPPFPAVSARRHRHRIRRRDRAGCRAGSLLLELALGPLMRGELRATEVRLVAPQFNVGLDAQGQIDWSPLALSTETPSIDRLSVERRGIGLIDAASGTRLTLDKVRVLGEVRSLTGPIRGSGDFVSDGATYGYELSAGKSAPEGTRVRVQPEDRRAAAECRGRRHAGLRQRLAALRRRAADAAAPSGCGRGRRARRWRASCGG